MIHPIKHFLTITHHRHMVMRYCFKCGLYRQGLVHDLSKYSITEFWRGAKYYAGGVKSPHPNERLKKGYSEAWMHHKGRNKHHAEYWFDYNIEKGCYAPVPMPDRYIAESLCDRIAASKTYNKKAYTQSFPLDYFNRENGGLLIHEETREKLRFLLTYLRDNGQRACFKYIKKHLRKKIEFERLKEQA